MKQRPHLARENKYKQMKPGLLIRLLILLLPAQLVLAQENAAQEAQSKEDKIKSLEIAYISRELDLTPEEAQKFWPLYNKYTREVNELIAERKRKAQDLKGKPRTDDKVAEAALDKELGYEKKMIEIKTRYKQEFLKAIPARKVGILYRSEREFRNMMIRQMKERRENKMLRRQNKPN
jgi:Spy/CpxP family protein refolding chaperone